MSEITTTDELLHDVLGFGSDHPRHKAMRLSLQRKLFQRALRMVRDPGIAKEIVRYIWTESIKMIQEGKVKLRAGEPTCEMSLVLPSLASLMNWMLDSVVSKRETASQSNVGGDFYSAINLPVMDGECLDWVSSKDLMPILDPARLAMYLRRRSGSAKRIPKAFAFNPMQSSSGGPSDDAPTKGAVVTIVVELFSGVSNGEAHVRVQRWLQESILTDADFESDPSEERAQSISLRGRKVYVCSLPATDWCSHPPTEETAAAPAVHALECPSMLDVARFARATATMLPDVSELSEQKQFEIGTHIQVTGCARCRGLLERFRRHCNREFMDNASDDEHAWLRRWLPKARETVFEFVGSLPERVRGVVCRLWLGHDGSMSALEHDLTERAEVFDRFLNSPDECGEPDLPSRCRVIAESGCSAEEIEDICEQTAKDIRTALRTLCQQSDGRE